MCTVQCTRSMAMYVVYEWCGEWSGIGIARTTAVTITCFTSYTIQLYMRSDDNHSSSVVFNAHFEQQQNS